MPAIDDRGPLDALDDGALARMIATSGPGLARDAEGELYRRFAPRVRLFGLKHLGDESAAQDLAHQVLLLTIERLRADRVRDVDRIGSFILGTSRMMTQAERRTEGRRAALRAEFAHLTPASVPPAADAPDTAQVEGCLQGLRERERTLLVLTFYAEQGSADIAATLGMTPGAVRVARHRALAQLRDCLERTGNDR